MVEVRHSSQRVGTQEVIVAQILLATVAGHLWGEKHTS